MNKHQSKKGHCVNYIEYAMHTREQAHHTQVSEFGERLLGWSP